ELVDFRLDSLLQALREQLAAIVGDEGRELLGVDQLLAFGELGVPLEICSPGEHCVEDIVEKLAVLERILPGDRLRALAVEPCLVAEAIGRGLKPGNL